MTAREWRLLLAAVVMERAFKICCWIIPDGLERQFHQRIFEVWADGNLEIMRGDDNV